MPETQATIDRAALLREARALASPRRLDFLLRLLERAEATSRSLAEAVGLSPPATSQHLTRLFDAGLVERRREGQEVLYSVAWGGGGALRRLLRQLEWEVGRG